jgi:hypothetical protein
MKFPALIFLKDIVGGGGASGMFHTSEDARWFVRVMQITVVGCLLDHSLTKVAEELVSETEICT